MKPNSKIINPTLPTERHLEVAELLFTHDQIIRRLKEVALDIVKYYRDLNVIPIVLGVATGGIYFTVDLTRLLGNLGMDCIVKFVSIKRYRCNGVANKKAKLAKLSSDLAGKHVLVLEDLIEDGGTLMCLHPALLNVDKNNPPKSIRYCVLIDKKGHGDMGFPIDHILFPNVEKENWVFGYGMDDEGYGRSKNDIYVKKIIPVVFN